jgi:hypothetical protein
VWREGGRVVVVVVVVAVVVTSSGEHQQQTAADKNQSINPHLIHPKEALYSKREWSIVAVSYLLLCTTQVLHVCMYYYYLGGEQGDVGKHEGQLHPGCPELETGEPTGVYGVFNLAVDDLEHSTNVKVFLR